MTKPPYTTRLQAGLGLVPETIRLLDLWQPEMDAQTLLKTALSSGSFPNVAARRLRNIVTEGFAPRYLIEAGAPAHSLKALSQALSATDFKHLLFFYTCRANRILGDFVQDVFWARYAAGATEVSKAEALEFVRRAVSDGVTTTHWSESTITRVASYLLGACADFGLLGSMRREARPILSFRPGQMVIAFVAHDLHFGGVGDNGLLQHDDWRLFGLEPGDVLSELKRLALRGDIIVQTAGNAVQISWKAKSMEEFAHGLTQG
ncbi:BrxA family protein [Iodidimonas sp. SYSU 1G8]|uniref:BrxA family protein n=1 Tax=Iodidimonas sp. SYSU 1G8 TaxID=3133967 RepID=UPI0031FE9E28